MSRQNTGNDLCLSVILLVLHVCIPFTSSLPYITDEQFETTLDSGTAFGIVPWIPSGFRNDFTVMETIFPQLDEALVALQKNRFELYLVNCDKSALQICSTGDVNNVLSLFQNKRRVHSIDIAELQTASAVESYFLHRTNTSFPSEVKSIKQWRQIMKEEADKKNIVLVYFQGYGSKIHDFLLKAALEYKDRIRFAYSTEKELAKQLGATSDNLRESGEVWLAFCSEGFDENKCITSSYLHILSASQLNVTLQEMLRPLVTKVDSSRSEEELEAFSHDAAANKLDSLLFTVDNQKQEKTFLLAKRACALFVGKARCFYTNSDTIDKNRIHLTIRAYEDDVEDIEVGYLLAEVPAEVHLHWGRLEPLRRVRRQISDSPAFDLLNEKHENREVDTVINQQDDPVVYALYNKVFYDFYLFDHQTLPRLTDVTYEDVIKSNKFAVILFTLEFNAKALAALSHFWQIHEEFKNERLISPLHRVECFDWPDVCSKANLSTYPKMFFYRGRGADRQSIEYTGLWSPNDMKKSIVLFSLSWPVDTTDPIPDVIDKVVYGLISTNDGEAVFRNVAKQYGHKIAFKLVREPSDIDSLSSKIDWNRPQKDGLMARSRGQYLSSYALFATSDDVFDYIAKAFHEDDLPELTTSNYQEYVTSPTPLFIQFKNDSAPKIDHTLNTIISDIFIDESYTDRANFVWMDSSFNTAGEYALHMYSDGRNPKSSLVFLSKQSTASIKSFEEAPNKSEILEWINLCLSGKAPIDFQFLTDPRTPLMEGHDYLRYVQEEGDLPIKVPDDPSIPEEADELTSGVKTKVPEQLHGSSKHTEL